MPSGVETSLLSVQIAVLLRGEGVDFAAPVGELAARNFLIDFQRDVVHHLSRFAADPVAVFHKIFCRKCLNSKAHIHNFCRMSVACCQVNKSALGQKIEKMKTRVVALWNQTNGQ